MIDAPACVATPADTAKLEVQAAMYKTQFTEAVERLEGNLSELFSYLENMAAHMVAVEEVVRQLARTQALNPAVIRAQIENKIAAGTEAQGDPSKTIAIAEGLLSH